MIAAAVLGLVLMTSESDLSPQLLEANAACRLVKSIDIAKGVMYSIPGEYRRGTHVSSLSVPGCDETVAATIVFPSKAYEKISTWHDAFNQKCGVHFIGDDFSGLFTGKFIRRKVVLPFGGPPPVIGRRPFMMNIFVISDFDGAAPAWLTCQK